MWIADGYKGLLDYRRQRVMETDRILFKGGNCFHDGVCRTTLSRCLRLDVSLKAIS